MLPVYLKTEVEVLDLNAWMPIFSVDIEEHIGEHPLAQKFFG
jgi:hypothetical protein